MKMVKNKINFLKKRAALLLSNKNIFLYITLFIAFLFLIYSFLLAGRRYSNYEFGKFDLGNMSQMVWNTGHGRFMEITDQFGTNMPRWGMSHVDPILLIFVPFYLLFPHPMLLVFFQQLIIISAVIPIFLYLKKNIKSELVSSLVSLTYLLYPAIGYTLIWTGFHGISFIAPLLIWLYWFLDKYNFLIGNKKKKLFVIYWILIVLMLFGKEEVGSMLSIFSVFLYLKNKKLATQTFIISLFWFIFTFFFVIPQYSDLRQVSVDRFISETKVENVHPDIGKNSNFFIKRYSYLGDTYGEMIINIIKKPNLITKQLFNEENNNKNEILYTFGPFGFLVLLNPFWLVSLPDLMIGLLSNSDGFSITNDRVGFVVSTLFIAYILIIKHIYTFKKGKSVIYILSVFVLLLTLYTSNVSKNPLFISGKSLLFDKIIGAVMADGKVAKKLELGTVNKTNVPRNNKQCLDTMVDYINFYNPDIYSGPDYLGVHSSNRRVNALFPSRINDAQMVIADIYDGKIYYAIGDGNWGSNMTAIKVLQKEKRFSEIFACGQMALFIENKTVQDSKAYINTVTRVDKIDPSASYVVENDGFKFRFYLIDLPSEVSLSEGKFKINFGFELLNEKIEDKQAFWRLKKKDGKDEYNFIDYVINSYEGAFPDVKEGKMFIEQRNIWVPKWLKPGEYDLYFGVGNLLEAREVLVGSINIK